MVGGNYILGATYHGWILMMFMFAGNDITVKYDHSMLNINSNNQQHQYIVWLNLFL